jgi:hypothetical protein
MDSHVRESKDLSPPRYSVREAFAFVLAEPKRASNAQTMRRAQRSPRRSGEPSRDGGDRMDGHGHDVGLGGAPRICRFVCESVHSSTPRAAQNINETPHAQAAVRSAYRPLRGDEPARG